MPSLTLPDLSSVNIAGLTAGKIISVLFTLLICLLAVRTLTKLVRRVLSRTNLEEKMQHYIAAGIKALLYVLTVLIVAAQLDIDTTSLVALLSVGSLGITLAAEDILGNVAGGLVILSSRPFSIGDFVEVGGTSGTVREISLNHTKLETADGLLVMMPNQELASSQVINYSALGRRRVVRKVTASYDAPTETVKTACFEALSNTAHVLAEPACAVRLTDYGASSIEYTLYCWADFDHYWDVYHNLNENLRAAFDAHGVEMTYDHLNVHIVENRG